MNLFKKFESFIAHENNFNKFIFKKLSLDFDNLKKDLLEKKKVEDKLYKLSNIIENLVLILEEKYSYGCIMLKINKNDLNDIYPSVSNFDLYTENNGNDKGMETYPHVTALYGLHSNEIKDSEIDVILKKYNEFEIEIIDISIFENDKFDVLKFKVVSEELSNLNSDLKKLPFSSDYPNFDPHITIAYLKKGTGEKYTKKFENNIIIKSNIIEYSKPGDEKNKKRIKTYKL